ncbi:MAG: hypothetical protein M1829_004168 [Trizodia sp. TS-e1964]|nr:MAG: hypothetical protein M1829_004168 [Trizodia sp. TS-e1964]
MQLRPSSRARSWPTKAAACTCTCARRSISISNSTPTTTPPTTALRWDTAAPTPAQLSYANTFFHSPPPTLLWSAAHFRTIPATSAPEVAFLGRSNVGKSSLLNALLGRRAFAHVSSKPGRTRTMNAFGVHGGRVVVLDMPGYGRASRGEWGEEIVKYLRGRKQLRRVFLMVDGAHGLKDSDGRTLELLRSWAVPHQVVVAKADRVLWPGRGRGRMDERALAGVLEGVRRVVEGGARLGPGGLGEVLACSAGASGERRVGISEIRWAILAATGLECDAAGKKVGLGGFMQFKGEQELGGQQEEDEEMYEDEDQGEDVGEGGGAKVRYTPMASS